MSYEWDFLLTVARTAVEISDMFWVILTDVPVWVRTDVTVWVLTDVTVWVLTDMILWALNNVTMWVLTDVTMWVLTDVIVWVLTDVTVSPEYCNYMSFDWRDCHSAVTAAASEPCGSGSWCTCWPARWSGRWYRCFSSWIGPARPSGERRRWAHTPGGFVCWDCWDLSPFGQICPLHGYGMEGWGEQWSGLSRRGME